MVKVREDHPQRFDGSIDIDAWIDRLNVPFRDDEVAILRRACDLALSSEQAVLANPATEVVWHGKSAFRTGLEMVEILAELKLDITTLACAILYRCVREQKLKLSTVEEQFSPAVAQMIKDVQGMAVISAIQSTHQSPEQHHIQLEKVRKMLVSIIDDVRVALVKLAERTCAIRAVANASVERQQHVAREVSEIYAPLAHRLGIGYIKWELEDLAFRYLQPEEYKCIAKLLDGKRLARQQYISDVVQRLKSALTDAGIKCEVYGRVKHIYSIWRKMHRKNLAFRDLYDIRAVRILTNEVQDCYAALGIVHSLWNHIPNEFDDYITTPKENGYSSLHTAVFGPEGKTVEVQIRTHAMHDEAELGVCAHWKYKGTDVGNRKDSYEEKMAWLRQVLEWHDELEDLGELGSQWRADVEPDRIYVFSKDGHVIDLPTGSTPIDYAYRIHSEIGNHCRGAKVNGRIVQLTQRLATGDQVDILTSTNAHPSRDWLNPDLGYIRTTKARAKITSWLKRQDRDSHIIDGQRMLEQELKRQALYGVNVPELLKSLKLDNVDEMHANIGSGALKLRQVIGHAQRQVAPEDEAKGFKIRTQPKQVAKSEGSINIDGVGNLLTQIAGCCQPVPGDPIIGYITVGRGVTIHHEECPTAVALREHEPARVIEVNWGDRTENRYAVEVMINAYARPTLLHDITVVLSNEKVNVLAMQMNTSEDDHLAHCQLSIEVPSIDRLGSVLAKLNQLPNVLEAFRQRRPTRSP